MRILVAGACGFLGWNLTRELRWRHPDWEIVGVDDLSTGVRRRNEFVDQMIEEDICSWRAGEKFDFVYHLASPASPVKYQRRPLLTVHANVTGLWNCLLHLRPGGTIFFASSSEVYGNPRISPQPETYWGEVNPVGLRSCYDESKRMCETICWEWSRSTDDHVKIARLFNVYGPGMLPEDGRCMSNFIWDAMHGRSVTIYGDGMQTRCFTYVDNVVQALIKLVEETPSAFVGPINIGTNVETPVRTIAVAVMAEVHKWRVARGLPDTLAAPEYLPAVADDPRQRLPDLRLAEDVLGWNTKRLIPYHGQTGGIARTIKYFETEWWANALNSNKSPAAEVPPAGDACAPVGVAGGQD